MEDSYVETKVEALQDNRVKVTVTLEAADIDARIKKTYKEYANKYQFPGFRKGKAPRPIIDNALGKDAVRAAVTDEAVNSSVPLAIDDNKLYPVNPRPEFPEAPGLVEGGKDYEFSFTIEVKPEVELSNYDNVEVELPAETATEEDVDAQVENFREHFADMKDAPANTKVKVDSELNIAMKVTDDNDNVIESLTTEERPYMMGSGILPAEFDEKLLGLKKGQSAQFELEIGDKPAELLRVVADEHKKLNFDVEVKAVRKRVLPEVTDEWVKAKFNFETVADFRNNIAEGITAQKQAMAPGVKERACLNALAERVDIEPPAALVETARRNLAQELFQQLQASAMSFDAYLNMLGMNSETFKEDLEKQATDTAKQDLALDAWARHYGIEVTDEDVANEFAAAGVEDPKKLEAEWRQAGQLYMIREGVLRTKAVKDLMDKAKVSEAKPEAKDEKKSEKKASKKSAKKEEAAAEATDAE